MNPFSALKAVQQAYLTSVHTFQKFDNATIQDWVAEQMERGTLLRRDPHIQLSRRFQKGDTLDRLAGEGLLPLTETRT